MRYAVYTMRRTSRFTVYAIYDTYLSQPVCEDGTDQPITTRDKDRAKALARELENKRDVGSEAVQQ